MGVRRRKAMALRDKDYKSVWRQSISNVVTLNKIAPERNWSVANDNGLHPLGFKNNNNQIQHEGYIGERQVDLMKLFIDTLFDYNALEALSLAVLIILMLIGLMLQGLLIYNTNVSGLETFEEINTEQSTTTLVANIFVLFFIGLIWFLIILVSTLMVMSVIIDVSRNVTYHVIDKMNHVAEYMHRITHFKSALKTAKKNVNELGKQERKLEAELRKMQHSHTQELEAMQKEYERKKRTMEEQIAKAKITHLRLQQEAKLLQIRMKKGGEDGPSKARLSALLNELNKGDKNQNQMKDDYNQMILQHKENSRALLDRCLQEQEKHRRKLQDRIRRRKREAKTEEAVHGKVMALNDVTEVGAYKSQVKLTVAKRNLIDKLNSHVDSLNTLHQTHFEGDREQRDKQKELDKKDDQTYLLDNMKTLEDQQNRDLKELDLERQARLQDARTTQSSVGVFSKEVDRINAEYDRERDLRLKEMQNEKKAHKSLLNERKRRRKAQREQERREREQAIMDKKTSAEQLQEEINDKERERVRAEEEAQNALTLYQQSKHLMEEDLKRSSALHHSKLQERLARRKRNNKKKKGMPHPPPPPPLTSSSKEEILEHATKAQNLHNMLKSLYLSTSVQQKDGNSDQLLTTLLSSMKALLDSTQINDLNAAVDEMKKENDNRGPSKSGK